MKKNNRFTAVGDDPYAVLINKERKKQTNYNYSPCVTCGSFVICC